MPEAMRTTAPASFASMTCAVDAPGGAVAGTTVSVTSGTKPAAGGIAVSHGIAAKSRRAACCHAKTSCEHTCQSSADQRRRRPGPVSISFRWPPIMDGVMKLSPVESAALFDGLDWTRVQTIKGILKPSGFVHRSTLGRDGWVGGTVGQSPHDGGLVWPNPGTVNIWGWLLARGKERYPSRHISYRWPRR
jgi:hypothetical protein